MWNVLAEQGQEGKAAWLRIWQMDMSALDSDRIAVLVSGILSMHLSNRGIKT